MENKQTIKSIIVTLKFGKEKIHSDCILLRKDFDEAISLLEETPNALKFIIKCINKGSPDMVEYLIKKILSKFEGAEKNEINN